MMFLIGASESNFIFWAEMGVGKTCISLNLIRWRHEKQPSLVLVPDIQNISNWTVECKLFAPELKVVPLIGSRKDRLEALQEEGGDIYIINYDGLMSVLSRGGRKIIIDPEEALQFGRNFQTVIYDEMVEVKNPKSISFQICRKLSQGVPYRYGLTGRPFGRVALDLWAQFLVVDGGETLGRNQEVFRQSFFIPQVTPFAIKWIPDDARKPLFSRMVKNKSIYFPANNPVPNYRTITIDMDSEAKSFYRKLKSDIISADWSEDSWRTKIKNPFIKFRQICSGYLIVDDKVIDEDTEEVITVSKEEISFSNPKENVLKDVVYSLPEGCKMIVFYAFTPSGRRIHDKLTALGIGHEWLWGGSPDKDYSLNRFKTDRKCRVLVANLKSGAVGLNLQVANYLFFYENSDTISTRAQAEARVVRRGQMKTVYIIDVLVRNSIEERIKKFLEEGQKLFEEIVQGKISEAELRKRKISPSFLAKMRSKRDLLQAIGEL